MRSFKPAAAALIVSAVAAMGTGVAAPQESLDGEQSYVLTFDDGVDVDAVLVDLEQNLDVTITHRFGTVLPGAVVTTAEVPEAMVSLPGVATVDRNTAVQIEPIESSGPDGAPPVGETPNPPVPGVSDPDAPEESAPTVPWGLDRVDQRALPLSGDYSAPAKGAGVVAYVVDSGISPHDQFGDRLRPGFDAVGDGRGTTDCDGHGTHVAGTIAGRSVGLAPEATVVPVRFLDCQGSGSAAGAIAAFDWIAANHPAGTPGVVNFSAGGDGAEALSIVIQEVLSRGLTVVSAAGNESTSACSAAGVTTAGAIVVGATDVSDNRAYYSNAGPCVDIFAPGDEIESASIQSPSALARESGTSMAAPHVAGAAAVLLSLDPWRTGPAVEEALVADATPGVVAGSGDGSPNLLLYSDPGRAAALPSGAAAPPPPSPEVASVVEVRITIVEMPIRAAQTAVLAFTGGDPRAMTMGGVLLMFSGWMALIWSRRRARFAGTMPTIRVGESVPDTFLQVRPRQGR